MTEPIFEIVKQDIAFNEDEENTPKLYTELILQYLSTSYGYYTQIFIKKISEEATTINPLLFKLNVKKMMRESCKTYALSDLQVVFLSYFCSLHKWNSKNEVIRNFVGSNLIIKDNQDKQYQELKIFLTLVSFFVKSYVGNERQFQIIQKHIKGSNHGFASLYESWVKSCSSEAFSISPRELNRIYSEHSKNCQKITKKKNYNQMVDNIIDLSITYSIIPARKTENQEIRKKVKIDAEIPSIPEQPEERIQIPKPQPIEPKKPQPRVLLNKKKNNQPNQMILNYHHERGEEELDEQKEPSNKDVNRSYLDLGLSYSDLRLNRSGRSSGLPIPWKPTSGFFEKSRFD